jgi:hypothetical protein
VPSNDGSRVEELDRERRRAAGEGAPVPVTPIVSVRRIETGRSTDPVWWANGQGWSAVVKVIRRPDDGLGWDHGAREVAAHRAGLLAALPPGVRAPRCLAVLERDDGTTALWLEGIEGPTAAHWPFAWYRTAAAGVGRMQGAFVAGVPLPEGEWVNRGAIGQYVADHPCDEGVGSRLRCDDHVIDALECLPRTLCHFDLHPRNMIVGDGDIVVLDWSSVGTGCLGEDPSTLVASAILDGHVPPERLRELFLEVTAGYSDGLRAAGLVVDDDGLVRALGALLVVRLGWVVGRRLAEEGLGEDDRHRAQALADVLTELAEQAGRESPRDVVRPAAAA